MSTRKLKIGQRQEQPTHSTLVAIRTAGDISGQGLQTLVDNMNERIDRWVLWSVVVAGSGFSCAVSDVELEPARNFAALAEGVMHMPLAPAPTGGRPEARLLSYLKFPAAEILLDWSYEGDNGTGPRARA